MSNVSNLVEIQRVRIARLVASDTRLAILKTLLASRKPINVSAIVTALAMTQSAISHQLQVMRRAGIVCGAQSEANGRHRVYVVDPQRKGAIKKLIAAFELL